MNNFDERVFNTIKAETTINIIPCNVTVENIPNKVVVHPGVDKSVKSFIPKTMKAKIDMRVMKKIKK